MIKKSLFIIGVLGFLFLVFATTNTVSAVCCEKTVEGAWCQNEVDRNDCIQTGGLGFAPTSCEATSYCKLGTCINSQEGTCMESTPQQKCQNDGGLWDARDSDDIPQCQLGCCFLGGDTAFTTLTRCKRLSSVYGLESNYRSDMRNQIECLDAASSDAKGACTFEEDFEKNCEFTTQKECKKMDSSGRDTTFHKDFLCSAEQLGTICGPSEKTTCLPDKDEVYYLDTCGNLANIYDASKFKDKNYWTKIVEKEDSCSLNRGLGNAYTCGNCDYLSPLAGSVCKSYDRTQDKKTPTYGDNVCRDLSCKYEGDTYQHGERWCAEVDGVSDIESDEEGNLISVEGEDLPGGRHFRLICQSGEVIVEPCAARRAEVCVETEVERKGEKFKNAACKTNDWQTCLKHDEQDNCEDPELGDCQWLNSGLLKEDLSEDKKKELDSITSADGWTFHTGDYLPSGDIQGAIEELNRIGSLKVPGFGGSALGNLFKTYNEEEYFHFLCLPKYAPGFNLQPDSDAEADSIVDNCGLASEVCQVTYQTSIFHRPDREKGDCEENCYCLPEDGPWLIYKTNMCQALGDCGVKVNYIEEEGEDNWYDFIKRSVKD